MTVSPPGHEHYFEELANLAVQGAPDPKALADLRNRYDTNQLSTFDNANISFTGLRREMSRPVPIINLIDLR